MVPADEIGGRNIERTAAPGIRVRAGQRVAALGALDGVLVAAVALGWIVVFRWIVRLGLGIGGDRVEQCDQRVDGVADPRFQRAAQRRAG